MECIFLAVVIFYWKKLLWRESQIQFHRDMECILDWNLSFIEKTPLRRESNTVPRGYGMYFRLSLYLEQKKTLMMRESNTVPTRIWDAFFTGIIFFWKKLTWGDSRIHFHKGMECILVYCNYFLLKKLCWGEFKIQFHRDMEYVLGCVNFLLKA